MINANFYIWGGAGDLATRKLLPALANLAAKNKLHKNTTIIGLGRRQISNENYKQLVHDSLQNLNLPHDIINNIVHNAQYHSTSQENAYALLKSKIQDIESDNTEIQNRVYYLATPPSALEETINDLKSVGLNLPGEKIRIVAEKPFGIDLESAIKYNKILHSAFDESSIYRIDHYLGKDTVQNLFVLRFANTVFESLWNRDRIDRIEIMVSESIGVEDRHTYYDKIGATRDMLQNHLTQLLTLIAMEVPARMDANALRNEKIKVLQSILPIQKNDISFGQYTENHFNNQHFNAYTQEEGIPPNSNTETFAALRLYIDNWRWQGVPFTLITGKRLPRKLTRIAVHFKSAPVCLFRSMMDECLVSSNKLLITLQPNEGFSLLMDVKAPGPINQIKNIPLQFQYKDIGEKLPDAYETLLLEIINGDQTLFVHAEEVERSWKLFDPILKQKITPLAYPCATWGPENAPPFAHLSPQIIS